MFDHPTTCDLLEAELVTMERAFRSVDPAAPVPSCPEWTVADLAKHLGRIHRWVAAIVSTASVERVDPRSLPNDTPDADADADTWASWLAAGGASVVAALRSQPADTPMWTWGDGDTAGWWARRQLHETLVHRIDAQLAAGSAWEVEPEVAVDAIDEHLANVAASHYFSPGVANLKGEGSLHLHTTDTDGEWMITLTPEGFDITREHGKGTVAARGPARDLLSAVTNRSIGGDRTEGLEVFGDADLLEWWFTNSALE